jgi:serine/threonine-protein kinase
VARLLEKDPTRRHRDAYHVLEELSAIAERVARPSTLPTLRDLDLTATLRSEVGAEVLIAEALRSTPAAWRQRALRFRELAARAHPSGLPPRLAGTLRALDASVEALAATRGALDASAASARQREEDSRNLRLRLGGAIDALGGDESRALGALEELAVKLEEARARAAAYESRLREAWRSLPPAPEDTGAPAAEALESLREAGRLAAVWLDAQRALETIGSERMQRERERDDLRFQIAQMKGRLGTLGADAEYELSALRERAPALDEELQALLDVLAAQAGEVVEHLHTFPALREDVRAAARHGVNAGDDRGVDA